MGNVFFSRGTGIGLVCLPYLCISDGTPKRSRFLLSVCGVHGPWWCHGAVPHGTYVS